MHRRALLLFLVLFAVAARAEGPDQGAQLARFGKWDIGIPPCDKCHGTDGRGIPPHFPALAGLPASYIIDALQAFRSDTRRSDPQGLMRRVAQGLSDEEFAAVARHYHVQKRAP